MKRLFSPEKISSIDYNQALKKTSYHIRTNIKSINDLKGKANKVEDVTTLQWRNIDLGEGLPFYGKVDCLMRKPPM